MLRASTGTDSSTEPEFWKLSRTSTVVPAVSALLRLRSTTLGCGPSRSAMLWAGTAIEPPVSCTDLAAPAVSTPTSLSAAEPPL